MDHKFKVIFINSKFEANLPKILKQTDKKSALKNDGG